MHVLNRGYVLAKHQPLGRRLMAERLSVHAFTR